MFQLIQAYFTGKGHACGITKREQQRPLKGHNYEFLPIIFPNLGHLEC